MFRIKAIATLALAGLGGATMGTDVYLSSHHPSPSPTAFELPKYEAPKPAPVAVPERAAPAAARSTVTIAPVTIASRIPVHHRVAPQIAQPPAEKELVPCSEWRSLDTGPADRGVRTLCVRDVPATQ
ncbi:MAG TPA: hypothetical protein VHC69_19275 [Polyangiaceae bacterium]|nr:hypothetical protein [Polyangiaceae bacterium]